MRSVSIKLPEAAKPIVPAANGDVKPEDGSEPATDAMQTDESRQEEMLSPKDQAFADNLARLKSILRGDVPIALYLDFLYEKTHSDLQILKNIKNAVETRNSVCHAELPIGPSLAQLLDLE